MASMHQPTAGLIECGECLIGSSRDHFGKQLLDSLSRVWTMLRSFIARMAEQRRFAARADVGHRIWSFPVLSDRLDCKEEAMKLLVDQLRTNSFRIPAQ